MQVPRRPVSPFVCSVRALRFVLILLALLATVRCERQREPTSAAPPDYAPASPPAKMAEPPDQPKFVPIEPGSDLDKLIDDTLAREEARHAARYPCRLFTTDEIGRLVGGTVESGSHAFNHRVTRVLGDPSADRRWRAETCSWRSTERNGPEVDELSVSRPEHFDTGAVACPPAPASGARGVETIDGLGDAAWWTFQPYGSGTLTVCSTRALVVVETTVRGSDSTALLDIARHIAERALE